MRSATSALAGLLVWGLAAGHAHADACEAGGMELALFRSRALVEPVPGDELGADIRFDGPAVGWGRCRGLRHHVAVSSFEAPDWGDAGGLFVHAARYQLAWRAAAWSAWIGLRAVSYWADDLRFGTPVVGVRAWPGGDVTLAIELESAGVFVAAYDGTPRRPTEDLALDVSAAWPATAPRRLELRVRARDYRIDDMRTIRDVTATAGLGLALATRPGMRGMPGSIGVGVRRDAATTFLLVAELAFGVGPY